MKRSVSLIILVAGTLLASCSSLQTISFDQLQAADVSFPDAVRKVAVINNMPVLKTKDNHEILSSELEGDGKVASEALAENIANVDDEGVTFSINENNTLTIKGWKNMEILESEGTYDAEEETFTVNFRYKDSAGAEHSVSGKLILASLDHAEE